jgi:hypothetical protein
VAAEARSGSARDVGTLEVERVSVVEQRSDVVNDFPAAPFDAIREAEPKYIGESVDGCLTDLFLEKSQGRHCLVDPSTGVGDVKQVHRRRDASQTLRRVRRRRGWLRPEMNGRQIGNCWTLGRWDIGRMSAFGAVARGYRPIAEFVANKIRHCLTARAPAATRCLSLGAILAKPGLETTFHGRLRPVTDNFVRASRAVSGLSRADKCLPGNGYGAAISVPSSRWTEQARLPRTMTRATKWRDRAGLRQNRASKQEHSRST